MSHTRAQGLFHGTQIPSSLIVKGLVGLAIVGALAGTSLFLASPVGNFVIASTSRMPERYVELSLTQHQAIPHQVLAGKTASFNVSVHNHLGSRQDIPYRAWIVFDGHQDILQAGVLGLNDDETTQVNLPFQIPRAGIRAQLRVELPERAETIHFWSQS